MRFPFCRRAVFADLGLSEREVALAQRPRTGRVTMLGVLGFTPSYKEDPAPLRTAGAPTHEEGTLNGSDAR